MAMAMPCHHLVRWFYSLPGRDHDQCNARLSIKGLYMSNMSLESQIVIGWWAHHIYIHINMNYKCINYACISLLHPISKRMTISKLIPRYTSLQWPDFQHPKWYSCRSFAQISAVTPNAINRSVNCPVVCTAHFADRDQSARPRPTVIQFHNKILHFTFDKSLGFTGDGMTGMTGMTLNGATALGAM